jgi:hypothetical protein
VRDVWGAADWLGGEDWTPATTMMLFLVGRSELDSGDHHDALPPCMGAFFERLFLVLVFLRLLRVAWLFCLSIIPQPKRVFLFLISSIACGI